jgi:type IV secretory pathway TrbD component
MQLGDALTQISEIRRQLARSEVFRGYRAATVASTGLIALVAAVVQSQWLPDRIGIVLALWLGAALVSVGIIGTAMYLRCRRFASRLENELTLSAVEQFLPCLVAGGLLTAALYMFAPLQCWLLPGLWALLFGLGVFASRRLLPRGAGAVGGWYFICGSASIALAAADHRFNPWHMAVAFGLGQLFTALFLYWNLERKHA